MIVLKQKHNLHGKNLLPLVMRLKDLEDIEREDLARLKAEHPLDSYSLDELETEFRLLTGESAPEVLNIAGKVRTKPKMLTLMHIGICLANEIGAPKGTPMVARSISPPVGSEGQNKSTDAQNKSKSSQVAPGSAATANANSTTGFSEQKMEDRVKSIEDSIAQFHKHKEMSEVREALKQISTLAARPNLTSPSVLIATVESLVDIAIRTSNRDAEYYAKALQACRRYENNDIWGLCQRFFGSSEDKKISNAIADWSKSKNMMWRERVIIYVVRVSVKGLQIPREVFNTYPFGCTQVGDLGVHTPSHLSLWDNYLGLEAGGVRQVLVIIAKGKDILLQNARNCRKKISYRY